MPISLMHWNVWFEEDISKVLGFLQSQPADVLCLQELTRGYKNQSRGNTWEYLASELGYYCQVAEMPIPPSKPDWYQANAILSKYPIVEQSSTWINESLGTDGCDDQFRAYLEVTLQTGLGTLEVGTTHMSCGDHDTTTPRKLQELGRLLDIIKQKKERYVFTGDLNAFPDSTTVQGIMQYLQHAGPDFAESSWSTKATTFDGLTPLAFDQRLDYLFTTNDVEVIYAKLLDTEVSDHLPILTELTF